MAVRTELRFVSLWEEEESDECARYRSGRSVSMTSGCEGEMIPRIDGMFMQSCFLKNSTHTYLHTQLSNIKMVPPINSPDGQGS